MKEIKLHKSTDKVIGALRCSAKVYTQIENLAEQQGVTKQEIVRAILEECIDDITFK